MEYCKICNDAIIRHRHNTLKHCFTCAQNYKAFHDIKSLHTRRFLKQYLTELSTTIKCEILWRVIVSLIPQCECHNNELCFNYTYRELVNIYSKKLDAKLACAKCQSNIYTIYSTMDKLCTTHPAIVAIIAYIKEYKDDILYKPILNIRTQILTKNKDADNLKELAILTDKEKIIYSADIPLNEEAECIFDEDSAENNIDLTDEIHNESINGHVRRIIMNLYIPDVEPYEILYRINPPAIGC